MPREVKRSDRGDGWASAFPVVAPTSETAWARFVDSLDPLDLPVRTAVVVAPHPDDETLACGGVMAHLAARGAVVRVLAVTDGEASHPGVHGLDAVRRAEQQRALDALDVASPPVRLGLPDGRVGEHGGRLADLIEEHCGDAEIVFAPWARDGHGDHDACGRAAEVVARRSGRRVLAYPVWAWQWAGLADLASMPWRRWTLDADARARKAAAIAQFATQITDRLGPPVVDANVLVRFQRSTEVFADVR